MNVLKEPAYGEGHEDVDGPFVIYRLEEAGATLLALPPSGFSPRLRMSHIDVVHAALDAYGWDSGRARPATPSAARITRMDEALGWITLIPKDRYVLRRIVGARSLVSPVTERHLYSWRRLGALMGADHKAVQRWHAQGIDMLVGALTALRRGGGRQGDGGARAAMLQPGAGQRGSGNAA